MRNYHLGEKQDRKKKKHLFLNIINKDNNTSLERLKLKSLMSNIKKVF